MRGLLRCCVLAATMAGTAGTACALGVTQMTERLSTCSTRAECAAHDGQRVAVVGVYTVWDPLPSRKLDQAPARQVQLMLGAEEGPFLEPWGSEQHLRPLDEISRFEGKKVRVVGTFRREMPRHPSDPPQATSLGGSCIQSIERLEALD
jgi:hypothetical protein